jgi:hypothetical protein
MEGLSADYISFEYGTNYSGTLLSNDKNLYYFSFDDYEVVENIEQNGGRKQYRSKKMRKHNYRRSK